MDFLHILWSLFLEAAPYLVVGFVVAGLLHQFLSPRFIQKHLGGQSWFNILKASVLGTPVPLCSCGVVPVGLGLRKDGASKATCVSFLIATPENGVESLSLTYSFFGLPFTIVRVVFSLIVANVTALVVALWDRDEQEPMKETKSCCQGSSEEAPRNGFTFVVQEFVPSIAKWVVFGFLLSALLTWLLPQNLLESLDPRWAVPLAGLIGIPMYVCASASTPIAYSLFMNGLSPGACLVFLLTGPATNSANFPVYLKALGARTTAIYYSGIYLVSIILGLAIDLIWGSWLLSLSEMGHSHHFHPTIVHYVGAVFLFALLAYGMWIAEESHHSDCCSE